MNGKIKIGCWVAMFILSGINSKAIANPQLNTENRLKYKIYESPLLKRQIGQSTAQHLSNGQVILNFDSRVFFLPDLTEALDDDSAVYYNAGFSWGITDDLELTLQFQHVDSNSPGTQGDFISERTEDNEAALELKQRLWQNSSQTQSLSGVLGASWGTRGYRFRNEDRDIELNNRNVFVSFQFPFTANVSDRWQFTVSPTIAFFNEKDAGFFRRLPDSDESFGTVFGFGGGVTYSLNNKISLWGNSFIPLTGNNSVSRESGEPAKAIAYNAGVRYLVNPRLAVNVFASNSLGSFAPLSLTADRDFVAFGSSVVFMPDLFKANQRISDRTQPQEDIVTPITIDGLAFYDGGVVNSGQFLVDLLGGSQGFLASLRYGLLKDLEAGIYLDYVSGNTDESEQGLSAKIRFLNQAEGAPFTASVATTIGITNETFVNFFNNDRNEFDRRDLDKSIPVFYPGADEIQTRETFLFTFSVPLHYEFANDAAVWLTPIIGYVQREGVEIAGFNVGGSFPVSQEFSLVGEVGANFAGEGNVFIGDRLEDAIPWTFAVRWTPLSLFGLEPSPNNTNPQFELYLTNRVGFSTWHQLRVRDQNETAVGVGVSLPF